MSAYLSLIGRRRGGRLFEAGRLLTFSAFKMGANSRLGAYSNKYGMYPCLNVIYGHVMCRVLNNGNRRIFVENYCI